MNELLTYASPIEEMTKDSSAKLYEKFSGTMKNEVITITFRTDRVKIDSLRRILNDYALFQNKKDEYCIKAIRNLIIKNNFLELTLELAEENITEDYYLEEIDKNHDKYVIDINYISEPDDIKVVNEIVKKIGLEFSIDEVAEMFSLDSKDMENKVAQIK